MIIKLDRRELEDAVHDYLDKTLVERGVDRGADYWWGDDVLPKKMEIEVKPCDCESDDEHYGETPQTQAHERRSGTLLTKRALNVSCKS